MPVKQEYQDYVPGHLSYMPDFTFKKMFTSQISRQVEEAAALAAKKKK